jgi:hypothetical protein
MREVVMVEEPIERHPGDAPLVYAPLEEVRPHSNPLAPKGKIVVKINPQGRLLENILSLIFQLVEGYDNSSIFSTAAAQIIAAKTNNSPNESPYNEGAAIALIIMISFRMVGTILMAANNVTLEYCQQKGEGSRKKTVRKLMELKLSLLDNYIALTADENGEYSRLLDAEFRNHKLRQLRTHRRALDDRLIKLAAISVESEITAEQMPLIRVEAGVNADEVPLLRVAADAIEQPPVPAQGGNQHNDIIPKGETAWSVINALTFSLGLAHYRDKFHLLTPYDKHILYATLGQITNSYKDVPQERAFGHSNSVARKFNIFITSQHEEERRNAERSLMAIIETTLEDRVTIKRPSFRERVVKKVGDFLTSNGAAISLLTGAAGLISLIPGANVIMMGVYMAAIALSVSFASLKVWWDIYKEEKYHRQRKAYDNETRRAKQAEAAETLLINAQTLACSVATKHILDQNEAQEIFDYNDELYNRTLSRVHAAEVKWGVAKIIAIVATLGSATLLGWNTVVSFSTLTTGIAGHVGLSIAGLVGASAITVPIFGALVAAGFMIFKKVSDLIQEYKEEQAKLIQVISNLTFQKQRAQMADGKTLRDVCVLSPRELLRRYIAGYLSMQSNKLNNNVYNIHDSQHAVKAKAKARTEFFQRIEKLVGVKKSEAARPEYYYGHLADFMCQDIEDNHEKEAIIELVTRLKYHMPEEDYAPPLPKNKDAPPLHTPLTFSHVTEEVIPFSDLRKKPAIFRPTPERKIDHAGNWERFCGKFLTASNLYSAAFNIGNMVSIGLALALTFASGPAFFIVAGLLISSFIGIAVTREVLKHYRNKRLAEYDQTLAHIEMRDKTAEYYLATQQAATLQSQAEKENLNARVFLHGLPNQAQAHAVECPAPPLFIPPMGQNRAVAPIPLVPQQQAGAATQLLPTAITPAPLKKANTASQINFGGLITNNASTSKPRPKIHSEDSPLLAASPP